MDSSEGGLCNVFSLGLATGNIFILALWTLLEGQSSLPFNAEFPTLILHMASPLHSSLTWDSASFWTGQWWNASYLLKLLELLPLPHAQRLLKNNSSQKLLRPAPSTPHPLQCSWPRNLITTSYTLLSNLLGFLSICTLSLVIIRYLFSLYVTSIAGFFHKRNPWLKWLNTKLYGALTTPGLCSTRLTSNPVVFHLLEGRGPFMNLIKVNDTLLENACEHKTL